MGQLGVFQKTVEKSEEWIHELMDDMGWMEEHRAYQGLRAVLHVLRDHIEPREALHLAAQMPMLIRGLFLEGWKPEDKPLRSRHRNQFIHEVMAAPEIKNNFDIDSVHRLIRSVFHLLEHKISQGEIKDILLLLPSEIRSLWPQEEVILL